MPVIFGHVPVVEALRAGSRRVERLVLASGPGHARFGEILEAARKAGIPVRREPRQALDRLTSNANHQGVVAVVSAATYADESALIQDASSDTVLLLLDCIEDPHNLGAIARTAECAGVRGIAIPERRAAHVTETVVKTSAGATEFLPIAKVSNLVSFIERLKKNGFWVVGIESSGKTAYYDYSYAGPLALVAGGEGHGLHRLVRERCDLLVSIPMKGQISSLNVSVATGIVLFEALRQMRGTGNRG